MLLLIHTLILAQTVSDPEQIVQIGQGIMEAYRTLGWPAAIAAAVLGLVKIVRFGFVQRALVGIFGPKVAWATWPKWVKLLFVFLLTAAGSAIASIVGGMPWPAALVTAVVAGVGAVGANETLEGGVDVLRGKASPYRDLSIRNSLSLDYVRDK